VNKEVTFLCFLTIFSDLSGSQYFSGFFARIEGGNFGIRAEWQLVGGRKLCGNGDKEIFDTLRQINHDSYVNVHI